MTGEVLQSHDYPVHPAADIFPMLDAKRHAELVADIAQNGLLEAIALFDGAILDGRNRLKACLEAGVAPRFVPVECDNPWVYAWSKNGNRRDLPDLTRCIGRLACNQGAEAYEREKAEAEARRRAAIAEKREEQPAPNPEGANQHKKRLDERNDSAHPTKVDNAPTKEQPKPKHQQDNENRSSHALAKQAGVGRGTMEKALSIVNFDQRHGTDYAEKIQKGDIKPTKALTEVKKANLAEKTRVQIEQAPTQPVIHQKDARAFLAGFAASSVDLLLTDPPYSTDVEDMDGFVAQWLPLALSKIKPTGRAYICIGAYPSELRAYLNALANQEQMTLANVLVWTYRNRLGPSPKTDYKLNWQAVLYLRGPDVEALDCPVMNEQFSVLDINAPDGRQGDHYHAWQKPIEIGERFVRHSTKAGDLVIDPFACTGTFLLAAAGLGRLAVGCDIADSAIDIAASRGCLRAQESAEVQDAA